jgi:hypothetical protein
VVESFLPVFGCLDGYLQVTFYRALADKVGKLMRSETGIEISIFGFGFT